MGDEDRILPVHDALDAIRNDLPLRQGTLHHGGKPGAALDSLRPDRNGRERRGLGSTQDHDAADGSVESAALDIKPSRRKTVQVRRVRQTRPEIRLERFTVLATRRPAASGHQGNAVVLRHSKLLACGGPPS